VHMYLTIICTRQSFLLLREKDKTKSSTGIKVDDQT
jgi:hypothetical protein